LAGKTFRELQNVIERGRGYCRWAIVFFSLVDETWWRPGRPIWQFLGKEFLAGRTKRSDSSTAERKKQSSRAAGRPRGAAFRVLEAPAANPRRFPQTSMRSKIREPRLDKARFSGAPALKQRRFGAYSAWHRPQLSTRSSANCLRRKAQGPPIRRAGCVFLLKDRSLTIQQSDHIPGKKHVQSAENRQFGTLHAVGGAAELLGSKGGGKHEGSKNG